VLGEFNANFKVGSLLFNNGGFAEVDQCRGVDVDIIETASYPALD